MSTVWMKNGAGPPKEVEYIHEEIVRSMVAGWVQCAPPESVSPPDQSPGAGETKEQEQK